jgi:hypothetical protein
LGRVCGKPGAEGQDELLQANGIDTFPDLHQLPESPPLWPRWRVSFVQVKTEDNPQSEPERCDVHVVIMPIPLPYSQQLLRAKEAGVLVTLLDLNAGSARFESQPARWIS